MLKREGRLRCQARKNGDRCLQLRLNAGARLLTGLARCLLDERPQRQAFARWSRQAALCRADAAQAQAQSTCRARQVVEKEFQTKRNRVVQLEGELSTMGMKLQHERMRFIEYRESCIRRLQLHLHRFFEARALAKWSRHAREHERLRKWILNWVNHTHRNALATMFQKWLRLSADVGVQRDIKRRITSTIDHCHRRRQFKLVGWALNSWRVSARLRRRTQKMLRRIAQQMIRSRVQKAMQHWGICSSESRRHSRLLRWRRSMLDLFRRRALNMELQRSLRAWVAYISSRQKARQLTTRSAARLRSQLLAAAFTSWQLHARHVRQYMSSALGTLQPITSRTL